MNSTLNYAADLVAHGYLVLEEPAPLKESLAWAYRAWGEVFSGTDKFALEGNIDEPSGYIPLCLRGGCDMKESFYCRANCPLPRGTEEPTRLVTEQLKKIAAEVAKSVDLCFGPGLIRNTTAGCLRVMRYPAFRGRVESPLVRRMAEEGVWRSVEHTDLNALSLLPSSTVPGLELLDKDGTWKLVDAVPGSVIVHAGQELERRSEHRFLATRHRVRNPVGPEANMDRFSMALFLS